MTHRTSRVKNKVAVRKGLSVEIPTTINYGTDDLFELAEEETGIKNIEEVNVTFESDKRPRITYVTYTEYSLR